MKNILILSFLALFIGSTGFAVHADAKRFGGGKSFGSSFKSKQNSAQPASQKNSNSPKATPAQGSKGGMMGMLGGLAMGGLLGAMFFGGGFEGINFMDILLFAGIGFAIFWFMRKSATSRQPEYAHAGQQHGQGSPMGDAEHEHDAMPSQDAFTSKQTASAAATPDVDPEFFKQAAKDIFMRMQADWDAKNLDDIHAFCTPEVAAHVAEEMAQLGENSNKTEVAMLNVDMDEMWVESDVEYVAVHFQAMLKEETFDSSGQMIETENSQMNERWIFQHHAATDDPTWYLSAIQQG
ncbi:MAG: Tim44-like domain-containing protein [Ghiorsea sp.]